MLKDCRSIQDFDETRRLNFPAGFFKGLVADNSFWLMRIDKMKPLLACGLLLAALCTSAFGSENEVRNSIVMGAFAFADNCRKCHETDGYGSEGLYPSLRRPELLADRALLIKTILHGRLQQEKDGTEARLMPSMDYLTNQEIAAIIAFVTGSWGKEVVMVSPEEIEKAR